MHSTFNAFHLQDVIDGGASGGIRDQQRLDQVVQLAAVKGRQALPAILVHLLDQVVEIVCLKWASEGRHLVQQATQGPDVTLGIVGLLPPDLWSNVVRGAHLRFGDTTIILDHFGDSQISNLDLLLVQQKDVGALQVPMKNVHVVEGPDPQAQLDKVGPDLILIHVPVLGLLRLHSRVQVPSSCVFRHNVQLVILHECLVVANYKFVTHRCQDSNLIGSLLSFPLIHVANVDLLDGVLLAIGLADDLVHRPVAALAKELDHLEI